MLTFLAIENEKEEETKKNEQKNEHWQIAIVLGKTEELSKSFFFLFYV